MEGNVVLLRASRAHWPRIRRLYLRAFPRVERAPYAMLKGKVQRGKAEMLVAEADGEFVGFVYLLCHADLAYLNFFAVDEAKRSMGYGGEILAQLREMLAGKRLFLACEPPEETAENQPQRLRRYAFYQRCGFSELPCSIRELGMTYAVMGVGGNVTPEEYRALMEHWAGKLMTRLFRLRMTDAVF